MSQDLETPPLYQAVLDCIAECAGGDVAAESIGLVAWERLSGKQRREALPNLLTAYVIRVHREEAEKVLEAAAWDDTHTYLAEFDTAMLWDSVNTPANKFDEVPVDINSLRNVLFELDLLQHRLEMRDAEAAADDTEGQQS